MNVILEQQYEKLKMRVYNIKKNYDIYNSLSILDSDIRLIK